MEHQPTDAANRRGALYHGFWRWHFYAALIVIPFLFLASLSGMLMLASKPIDTWLQRELRTVTPREEALPATTLLAAVQGAMPGATVELYLPPRTATEAAHFAVVASGAGDHAHGEHGAPATTVFVDPYTGEVLGSLDPATTVYARIKAFHASLYLGIPGERLVEVAAGLAVLMVGSGLYLAWRNRRQGRRPGQHEHRGTAVRSRHRLAGMVIAVPLLFFLLSGLAWTGVWGGKLVQPWSSVPGAQFNAPASAPAHQSRNRPGLHREPWALEQTPMPASGVAANEEQISATAKLDLDTVLEIAQAEGFTHYRVHLPREGHAFWTLSSTTIAGDVDEPRRERTLHLNRDTGEVLADIRFRDYPVLGAAMSAGIPLHQGDLGTWNVLLNLSLAATVLFMCLSGTALWWHRRPAGGGLAPPATPAPAWRRVFAVMFTAAFLFPLSVLALLAIALLDRDLFGRGGSSRR